MTYDILKKYFWYDDFRPLQEEIIATVLAKKDCLVVMPTWWGKSLCFQIPALQMDGVCIVISPLISLMHDQVTALKENWVSAAYINSSQSFEQQLAIRQATVEWKIKLLYISPEKLQTEEMFDLLKQLNVSFFAIDEAHCVSLWWHDFRPEYSKILSLTKHFPNTWVITLTATADATTRKDIIKQIWLKNPKVFIASFDRPNLSLTVATGQKKFPQIVSFIQQHKWDSWIIYCLSRKDTENLANKLRQQWYNASFYHAGMDTKSRQTTQDAFLKDDIQIMCATIAFGMWIDKANVRRVIHYNMPKNLEWYYQEIWRAGRDWAPADTLLFYSYADVISQRRFIDQEPSDIQACKISKLERIQQFAETNHCRRKMLLSYFGENLEEPCWNCDVCKNPPETIDGTIIAQKALSAIARLTDIKPHIWLIIDFLRASNNQYILVNDLHLRKTYGVGKDISKQDRQQYIQQLISIGLISVDYENQSCLTLNEQSNRVLFEKEAVMLVNPQQIFTKTAKENISFGWETDELFETLKKLRKKIADEEKLPPFIIFHDTTLQNMAYYQPIKKEQILDIQWVWENKCTKYGQKFIQAIQNFLTENPGYKTTIIKQKKLDTPKIKTMTSTTNFVTGDLYKQGHRVEKIAQMRWVKIGTVMDHLCTLYINWNIDLNINDFVSPDEIKIINEAIKKYGIDKLKPLFEYAQEKISYDKIRFCVANRKKIGK